MLSKKELQNNKNLFIELTKSIHREGANIDKLVKKLESSDFFYAPASTKYHCAYEGGLCKHSLNVYYNLLNLINNIHGLDSCCYDEDTLKIVALFHDISKMNIYELTSRNKKVYNSNGSKYDELGKFDWISEIGFKVKDNAFIYGSHEMTSEYIIRQYIPITLDESIAILHHMGGKGWDSAQDDLTKVYNQYSLSVLLHIADMLSTYIDERIV